MSTWTKQKLGDVIDIKHGFAYKGGYFVNYETPYVLLTPGNFALGGGFQDGKKYYNGPLVRGYTLSGGELVVTMTDLSKQGDTLGFSAITPQSATKKYLHNQRIGLVTAKNKETDLRYISYVMRTRIYQRFVVGSASGATVKHTSPKKIYEYVCLLPDPKTQTRIASFLSAYDDLIENNGRRIKVLEEMAQLLYTEWFVKFKFPDHEKVKMVDSGTEYGKIPEGWEIRNVENLIKRVPVGKKYENKSVFETGKVPVLDQGKSGFIGYHNDEPGVNASVENPVIVFANHTCYQNIITHPFSVIQNVLPFIPSDERDIFWLHWATKDLIKFNDYRGHWPEFMVKKLIVPSIDETEKFGALVSKYVAMRFKLEMENKNLSKTCDLLIPQVVTGKRELE